MYSLRNILLYNTFIKLPVSVCHIHNRHNSFAYSYNENNCLFNGTIYINNCSWFSSTCKKMNRYPSECRLLSSVFDPENGESQTIYTCWLDWWPYGRLLLRGWGKLREHPRLPCLQNPIHKNLNIPRYVINDQIKDINVLITFMLAFFYPISIYSRRTFCLITVTRYLCIHQGQTMFIQKND